MSSEARPHAKSRLASGWRPCNGASTCGGAQGMAGAQGCRCRALGHRGAQPQAAGTSNPPTLGGGTPHHRFLASHPRSWGPAGCRLQGGGGGTPHHRFLASPACWQRLTRRLLAAGQRGGGAASPQVVGCREGGGGRRTTGSWRPLHAGSASSGGCWRLGCGGGGGGGLTTGCWPSGQVREPAVTHARSPLGVRGTAGLVNATEADAGPGRRPGQGVRGGRSTGQLRLFLAGPCQFMARSARG